LTTTNVVITLATWWHLELKTVDFRTISLVSHASKIVLKF